MKTLLPALALLAAVAVSGCGRNASSAGPSNVVHVDQASFAAEVEQVKGVVVVDFWASWCGPCLTIAPTLDKLSIEYNGRVKICKVDVDANGELAERFHVESIPLLVLFKNGKAKDLSSGVVSEDELRTWFDKNL